jgi:hypothetical protein
MPRRCSPIWIGEPGPVPTFATTPRFGRDFSRLTAEQRERLGKVVLAEFVPDADASRFRPGLRVKGVPGAPGVYEMTWAPDGRAI